jgi:hypothetical protein
MRETPPEAFAQLTATTWLGPTGRIYGRSTIWDTFGKEQLLLAEAIRKQVLYELARTGFTLAAAFYDTILIEQPAHASVSAVCDSIEATVRPVVASFLGDIPLALTVGAAPRFPMAYP